MPETTKTAFDFHGFHSLREYEAECARVGHTTRRVPFRKGSEKYFALVTTPPGHPTGTSVEAWALFDAAETAHVLDGVINGLEVNYLGKLAAHGYYPEESAAKSAPAPAPSLEIVEDGTDFPQFSLLSM